MLGKVFDRLMQAAAMVTSRFPGGPAMSPLHVFRTATKSLISVGLIFR